MKMHIVILLSLLVVLTLFTACSKGNDNNMDDENAVTTVSKTEQEQESELETELKYVQEMPFYLADIRGLKITGKSDEQILELFDQMPSYGISRRLYYGEDTGVEDSFKVIKDEKFLYVKLFYEKLPEHDVSKSKQHIILLREADSNGTIMTATVNYEQVWNVALYIKDATKGVIANVTSQVEETDTGFDAFVKIPLEQLNMDPDKIQMNCMRIDWSANPVTTYFPIENSYFLDYSSNAVNFTIFLGRQGRMIDVKFVGDIENLQPMQPKIKLDCIGSNKLQVTIEGKFDYKLSWQSPGGTVSYPVVKHTRINDSDVLTFDNPPVNEEGIYRIRLGNEKDTVLYVEKKAFVKAANKDLVIEVVEKEDVEISTLSDRAKFLLEIVPPYSGLKNIPDPKDTSLRPYALYSYDILNPHHIKSIKTGDLYPSKDYPETEVYRFDNGNGNIIEYPYYKNEEGIIFFFTPALWSYQKDYVNSALPELAKTDPVGAAHVLAKVCENYENHAAQLDYYFTNYPVSKVTGPPYPYYGGLWTRWFYADLDMVANIAEAYVEINKTNAIDKLSTEIGRNLHEEIIYIIEEGVDVSFSYGIQDSNMDYAQWRGLIRIGKALQQPDYIHYALERIDSFVKNNYLYDGFWKEVTLSYHKQVTSGLYNVLSLVTRYSDPEGYVYPGTGVRLDDYRFLDYYPLLRTSYNLHNLLSYPNGKYLPVQDTHPSQRATVGNDTYKNVLMSASGIAKLTGNTDALKQDQTHAVMMFTPKYGHNHNDALSLSMFSYNVEVLPDIGYTHTRNRSWTTSTLGHNTVTVNQKNSQSKDGGNVLRYVPSENTVGVMRAYDQVAYNEIDLYDREVVYVPMNDKGPEGYVLDIFRVSGGNTHEYSLNMGADYDYELTTDIHWQYRSETMLPEGVKYTKPTVESSAGSASGHYTAYMFVEDVQSAELVSQPYKISYVTTEGLYTGTGLNILGAADTGEIFMGKAPSMRATRTSMANDLNDQCDDYYMDKMIYRRKGEDLNSLFVTVMEPFSKKYEPQIHSVEKLQIKGLQEFNAVIKVSGEGFVDYIFSAYDEDMSVSIAGIYFEGQFGFIRIKDNKAVLMQGLNATLTYDGTSLPENLSTSGYVTDVLAKTTGDDFNGFVVTGKPDESLKGKYIVVKHPDGTTNGYLINRIVDNSGSYFVDIGGEEPGFVFTGQDNTKMIYYPHIERQGNIEYIIDDTGYYSIN